MLCSSNLSLLRSASTTAENQMSKATTMRPFASFNPFLNPFWVHPVSSFVQGPPGGILNAEPLLAHYQGKQVKTVSKKGGIFRPWDDHIDESGAAKPTCASKKWSTANVHVEPVEGAQTGPQATLELLATNLGKSLAGHRCIYCGKLYSRKYGLKIHLRTHTNYKPLQCKVCKRAFGDPSNLNKHTRLHAEAATTSFKCHLCGKLLVRKRDLERHLHSRHSVAPSPSGDADHETSVDVETL
uniref:C2H2-type domain-containing protein n=1 Tax=Plectus sambesii TaxID=2011161 RepID=A0A914UHB0_9BILA